MIKVGRPCSICAKQLTTQMNLYCPAYNQKAWEQMGGWHEVRYGIFGCWQLGGGRCDRGKHRQIVVQHVVSWSCDSWSWSCSQIPSRYLLLKIEKLKTCRIEDAMKKLKLHSPELPKQKIWILLNSIMIISSYANSKQQCCYMNCLFKNNFIVRFENCKWCSFILI